MSSRAQVRGNAPVTASVPVHTKLAQRTYSGVTHGWRPGFANQEASPNTLAVPTPASDCSGHAFGAVRLHAAARGQLQARLAVGQPGDAYEQEADRVADLVLRTPDTDATAQGPTPRTPLPCLQRFCAECEEEMRRQPMEEEEEVLQGKEIRSPEVAPAVETQIQSLRSGGQALPESERSFFEPRFGHDFGHVRVHTDARAAQSARAVRALAYTVGQNVVFAAGQYAPETPSGRRLLAHELAHVLQQGGGQRLMRQEDANVPEDSEGVILPVQVEVAPELSIKTFGPQPGLPPGGGPAPEEEAAVTRQPSAESPAPDSPEGRAAAEAPYPTGMSPERLAAGLQGGQKLDASVRAAMETRYGHSLDHVRIHTDARAASLCERFAARAFAFGHHIAFSGDAYAPGTPAGEQLLRHEVTHVLQAPAAQAGVFRVPAVCPNTCPPAAAHAFAPFSNTGVNCYGYAKNFPPSGFLAPGEIAGTAEFTAQNTTRANPSATAAALTAILPYFTPAGVKKNTQADLGSPLSSDCTNCCWAANRRKIIEVTTDAATGFAIAVIGGAFAGWVPMVSSTSRWDFHWYRKDADRSWSHKRGQNDAQQDDAAGTAPICNPCNASRSYSSPNVNYGNVVGAWCVS